MHQSPVCNLPILLRREVTGHGFSYMSEREVVLAHPTLDRSIIREMPKTFAGEVYTNRRRFYTQNVYLKSTVDAVAERAAKLPRKEGPAAGYGQIDEGALATFISDLKDESAMMTTVRPRASRFLSSR